MTVSLVEVDVEVVARATRASWLIGTDVYNDVAEHIGTIDDLMLISDRVEFTILAVGGFLGLGAHLVAIPYEALDIRRDRILADATREELRRLPRFEYQ